MGKTSLSTRFARGLWTENYKKTIGTDFLERDLILSQGDSIRLLLWDTAGQEMFAEVTRQYYMGAGAAVLVFSTGDRESFLAMERWFGKVKEYCGDIPCVMVQNKVDLLTQAKMEACGDRFWFDV